jgi:hypothetical protein
VLAAAAGYAVAAIATRVLEPVTVNEPELPELSDDMVRCAGCGALGRWAGEGTVVNATSGDMPPLCPETFGRRRRAHGPWLPEPVTCP